MADMSKLTAEVIRGITQVLRNTYEGCDATTHPVLQQVDSETAEKVLTAALELLDNFANAVETDPSLVTTVLE